MNNKSEIKIINSVICAENLHVAQDIALVKFQGSCISEKTYDLKL